MMKNSGLVLLPTIIVLGSVIVGIGSVGLLAVSTLNRSNYSIRLSATALSVANSGISDANLRINRNPIWTPASCYVLNVGSYSADVCVEKTGTGYIVNSSGTVLLSKRQLKAIFDVDPVTNQV